MTESTKPTTMQIGEIAERTGLSFRTLRHYDEVGLLQPSARSEGGFRLYTEADAQLLLVIRRMKPLGYSLDEMREVLRIVNTLERADHAEVTKLRSDLSTIVEDARQRRGKLERQLAMADEFIALLAGQMASEMASEGHRTV